MKSFSWQVVLFISVALAGCISMPKAPEISEADRKAAAKVDSGPFAWGISTSSYQFEDPAVRPGQPEFFLTDWDAFVAKGKAPPKGNALYSWTHFDKDLAALKKIGVTHYRFSLEWARIEPKPGEYNEAAIERYVGMARKLAEAGIEPVACLWHFTFPSWLYDENDPAKANWLHPDAARSWRAYVEKVVPRLAPHVRFYAPQNEPNGQLSTAYLGGEWPPGVILHEGLYDRAMRASISQFRDAAAIIKRARADALVLSVAALPWWEKSAIDVTHAFYDGMEQANFQHLDGIWDVCDIIGFNYYYSNLASPVSYLTAGTHKGKDYTMMGWKIDPEGLAKQIRAVAKRYGKPMMITENGVAAKDDAKRITYLREHIGVIEQAKRDGYDVRGYFVWSLADNYEWHYGFTAPFGLATMNEKTFDRVLKPSAYWYRDVIRRGGLR